MRQAQPKTFTLLKLMEGAQEGGMGVEGGGVIVSASVSVHLSAGILHRYLRIFFMSLRTHMAFL